MKFKVHYKCIFCSMFFALLAIHTHAQKLSIHVKDMPLVDVMKIVKKQTGYSFFYNSDILAQSNNVTIDLDNENIKDALPKIFATQNNGFTYSIANKTVVVHATLENKNNLFKTTEYPSAGFTIQGTVMDVFKTKLPGVTIVNSSQNENKNNIALTDKNGAFIIVGKVGDTLIAYSPEITTTQIIYKGEKTFSIVADLTSGTLERVTIQSVNEKKKDPTRFVDLTNRLYMNLGQVLQGTIPGLSMQLINTSGRVINKISVYTGKNWITFTQDEFLRYGYSHAKEIVDGFLSGNPSSYVYGTDGQTELVKAEVGNTVSSAMVPQIRGTNTFGSGINGMLVVIDGFPQDGFPSDYPMSNVESIEVIKDPKELIKWGDKATGGVILIKTKGARQNKPTINLNTSFYFTPASKFNRNKLKLANSAEYLDYYKDLFDHGFITLPGQSSTSNQDPALRLIYNKNYGNISDAQYNNSWDSLSSLNNQDPMGLLQQNSFNNIYNLSVMGGTKHYKYNFIGMYNGTKSNAIGNYTHNYALSSTNDFLLLKDKLHITWFSNVT